MSDGNCGTYARHNSENTNIIVSTRRALGFDWSSRKPTDSDFQPVTSLGRSGAIGTWIVDKAQITARNVIALNVNTSEGVTMNSCETTARATGPTTRDPLI